MELTDITTEESREMKFEALRTYVIDHNSSTANIVSIAPQDVLSLLDANRSNAERITRATILS